MVESVPEFSTAIFSVMVDRLAPHCNPVPCVLRGLHGPVSVVQGSERISGDVLFIRPGVEHSVTCAQGLTAIYLDGLQCSNSGAFAYRLPPEQERVALEAMAGRRDAARELRFRLGAGRNAPPHELALAVSDLIKEPMSRMTQIELAARLKMGRTSALRLFKAATGQTFRRFKQWSALQHAARQIAAGELVRTAAMDAGFADTAHLSRTFRTSFGLSPAAAIAGGAHAG